MLTLSLTKHVTLIKFLNTVPKFLTCATEFIIETYHIQYLINKHHEIS